MGKGKKQQPARVNKEVAQRTVEKVQFSSCAQDYGDSLLCPWGPAAPCLPMGFPLPSAKRKVFCRGEATVGTEAIGFIALAPGRMCCNDVSAVYSTNGQFAGTTVDVTSPDDPGVDATGSNSDYKLGDMGLDAVQYRLVSAGVRVKYRGTELNRGGRYIMIEEPDHQSLQGLTMGALLAYDNATTMRPPGEDVWLSVLYSGPKTPGEIEYAAAPLSNKPSTQGTAANDWLIVVALEGQPQLTVEWEAWANFEFIGSPARGKTPSHYDPIGSFSIANALDVATSFGSDLGRKAMAVSPTDRGKNRHHKSWVSNVWSHARHLVKNGVSQVVPKIENYVRKEGLALAGKALTTLPLLL